MSESVAMLLGVIVGAIVGVIAILFAGKGKAGVERQLREQAEQSLREQLETLRAESERWRKDAETRQLQESQLGSQLAQQTTLAAERGSAVGQLQSQLHEVRQQLATLQETERTQAAQIQGLTTTVEKERQNAQEKLKVLNDARAELTHQFKVLAGEIFEDKSTKFTEQNKTNLDQLLNPLRVQIQDFRGKVEEAQRDSNLARGELRGKLESLEKLNQQLSSEAHNLTTALRGSSKTQGDWGEMILRDLLDKAGLREGEQYRFQENFSSAADEDGQRSKASRTDIILNLPNNRHLIVDSKVSLNDYSEYCNSQDEDLRNSALKRHLSSVRTHVEGLSSKNYHKLSGLSSPDFVVMFIPIEPAFHLAIQESADLWRKAYESNVLLVGPTTLLFVIRIVDSLWQQEKQAQNVRKIADRGTQLYEKFVGFVSDIEEIGKRISATEDSYKNALSKLSTGRGNLIRQAEELKKYGVHTKKQLPEKLLDSSGLDAEEQAELSLAASGEESFELK